MHQRGRINQSILHLFFFFGTLLFNVSKAMTVFQRRVATFPQLSEKTTFSIHFTVNNAELKFNHVSFQGMKIVGATCSTERASEYNFLDGNIDPNTNTIVHL